MYKGGAKQQPGQLAIINLQRTQHDNKAGKSGGLVCHARCDDVMRLLVQRLQLAVPAYERRDAVLVGHQQHSAGGGAEEGSNGGDVGANGESSSSGGGGSIALPFSVSVHSVHGPKCPMPMVQSVDVSFEVRCGGRRLHCSRQPHQPDQITVPAPGRGLLQPLAARRTGRLVMACTLPLQDPGLKPASLTAPPFTLRRTARRAGPLRVSLTLHLHEAADEGRRTVAISYTADLQHQQHQQQQPGLGPRDTWCQQRHEFVSQVVEFDVGQQQQQEAAVADDFTEAAVAAAAVAAAAAAEDPTQLEPPQQLKKQRVS